MKGNIKKKKKQERTMKVERDFARQKKQKLF